MRAIAILALAAAMLSPTSVRSGDTVRLIVDDSYGADSRFVENEVRVGRTEIRRVSLPYKRLAAKLLAYAGARLADDAAKPVDATVTITADGLALGQLYDYADRLQRKRDLRFIAARLAGRIDYAGAGRDCTVGFSARVGRTHGIPIVAGRDHREAPQFAPFDEAMRAPGSFVAALVALVGVVYGDAPLHAARTDRDTDVAGYATAVLEAVEMGMPDVHCATRR